MATLGDDADMKIAGEHFSKAPKTEDASDQAAREFLRQKQSGNIDRARELGKRFSQAVIHLEDGPLCGELERKPLQVQHHQYLLYTYAVNRVIAEFTPNSILAQTSLNVYYSEIEQASAELYRHVCDVAAFSLYILIDRSRNRSDDEIGLIFADLCGVRDDKAMIEYGNALFLRMYQFCSGVAQSLPYAPVEEE